MSGSKTACLALGLFVLCFVGACRTTERELRSIPPDVLRKMVQIDQAVRPASATSNAFGSREKIQWTLVTTGILAVVIMIFASDRNDEKKQAPARRRSKTKKRKKKQ